MATKIRRSFTDEFKREAVSLLTSSGRLLTQMARELGIRDRVRDIVGLYLDPPDRALVLCIDEKSQIQALDRTQPLLPMRPGQVERHTHDYKRHGTTSLFAALDVKAGTIIGKCMSRHRAQEFRRFLDTVERNVPADLDIHIIMDNASSHKTKLIRGKPGEKNARDPDERVLEAAWSARSVPAGAVLTDWVYWSRRLAYGRRCRTGHPALEKLCAKARSPFIGRGEAKKRIRDRIGFYRQLEGEAMSRYAMAQSGARRAAQIVALLTDLPPSGFTMSGLSGLKSSNGSREVLAVLGKTARAHDHPAVQRLGSDLVLHAGTDLCGVRLLK